MATSLVKVNHIGRYGLAFVFFYHGLIPKILWPSQVETSLVMAHNFGVSATIISSAAGAIEILLALTIVFYIKSLIPVYIAALMLIVLLFDVYLVMPELLTEAFNPVSTNISALVLCYLIYITQTRKAITL